MAGIRGQLADLEKEVTTAQEALVAKEKELGASRAEAARADKQGKENARLVEAKKAAAASIKSRALDIAALAARDGLVMPSPTSEGKGGPEKKNKKTKKEEGGGQDDDVEMAGEMEGDMEGEGEMRRLGYQYDRCEKERRRKEREMGGRRYGCGERMWRS